MTPDEVLPHGASNEDLLDLPSAWWDSRLCKLLDDPRFLFKLRWLKFFLIVVLDSLLIGRYCTRLAKLRRLELLLMPSFFPTGESSTSSSFTTGNCDVSMLVCLFISSSCPEDFASSTFSSPEDFLLGNLTNWVLLCLLILSSPDPAVCISFLNGDKVWGDCLERESWLLLRDWSCDMLLGKSCLISPLFSKSCPDGITAFPARFLSASALPWSASTSGSLSFPSSSLGRLSNTILCCQQSFKFDCETSEFKISALWGFVMKLKNTNDRSQ